MTKKIISLFMLMTLLVSCMNVAQAASAPSKWVMIRPVKVEESIRISSHGIRRLTSSNAPSRA